MKPYTRAVRVGNLIKEALSELLHSGISDPRLEMVTISQVRMSADLKIAKIYFITSGDKVLPEDAEKGLHKATGYIKRSLGPQLGLRYMPKLLFFYDNSFDYGSKIERLLESVKRES